MMKIRLFIELICFLSCVFVVPTEPNLAYEHGDFYAEPNVFEKTRVKWPALKNPEIQASRRADLKSAFQGAWKAYKKYAWGADELYPLTKAKNNWLGGQGTMIIDTISTMLIMNLPDEYEEARDWVKNKDVVGGGSANLFETTIRILAGLISAYDLSGDVMFLQKAEDLGDAIIQSFDANTITSIPSNYASLNKRRNGHMERMAEYKQKLLDKNDSILYTNDVDFFTPTTANDLLPDKGASGQYGTACLAEFALWLEFVALGDRTGDRHFSFHALRPLAASLKAPRNNPQIIPQMINRDGRSYATDYATLGACGDSYYEYVIKEAAYAEPTTIKMPGFVGKGQEYVTKTLQAHWADMMSGFYKFKGTSPEGFVYAADTSGSGNWEHLACFAPGNLAFGAFYMNNFTSPLSHSSPSTVSNDVADDINTNITEVGKVRDLISKNKKEEERKAKNGMPHAESLSTLFKFGADIMESCYAMYSRMPSRLSGEFVNFARPAFWQTANGQYFLRPEVVESLFYLYRTTGDVKYQDYAWSIWTSIKNHSRYFLGKEDMGFTSLTGVNAAHPTRINDFPSFFMSETIKYLYLIFCDSSETIPLDQYVFTTEAHPIVKRKYLRRKKTIL